MSAPSGSAGDASAAADGERQPLVGQPLPRREDPGLVTGAADYTDDLQRPRLAHAAILRSRYAHARIASIDTSAAEAHDDVVAVVTAADAEAESANGFPAPAPLVAPAPTMSTVEGPNVPPRPLLSSDRVRYTGEALAVVVAENRYAAHEAADLVDVEYERLDAVVDPGDARAPDAPTLHDEAPDNLGFVWENGDASGTADAFEDAANAVSLELTNQRLAPNPLEPRTTLAEFDRSDGSLTVHTSTQSPHNDRTRFAESLGVPEHKVRVVAPSVGGGFGSKGKHYAGDVLAALASKLVGRPVKWTATRSESMRTDNHGRAHETTAELAFEDDGTVRGLRVDTTMDLGAYLSMVAAGISTMVYTTMLSGQYAIPAIHARITTVYTNTAPVDAYRGAGRPEAGYVVERLMDAAAAELGMDPAEFRRRNVIGPDAFPYRTAVGSFYDSGDYEAALDRALELADYEALRERQAELCEEGRYLGVGIGSLVESSGTPPGEGGLVRFHPSGTVTAYAGTFDHGQGHETTYAQVVADELGVPYEDVEVVEGDTAQLPRGGGTFGSRSAIMGGNALVTGARKVVEAARPVAAHHLEAAESDVEFEDGAFHVVGAPERSVGIQDVARMTYAGDVPDGVEHGLEATAFQDPVDTYPFGTHVAVVEVDPTTGEVDVERYVAVDDCGNQLNPRIVEGQVHGAVAQGVGQAFLEEAVYDGNGNLVTGSFQDYAMPRAEHVPEMITDHTVTPSPNNDLGVKGIGEAGCIGGPPAIVNAVVDALAPLGVAPDDLQMPLTSETVWRAIRDARAG